MMNYFSLGLGLLRATFLSVCSLGAISFRFPLRLDATATLHTRRKGKIRMKYHVSVNRGARVVAGEKADITVGSYTQIGYNNVIVAHERIILGDYVMLGPNVCIYDHDHVYRKRGIMRDLGYTVAPVEIQDNVWIGAGVIILKGVTIGKGSVIAAGTVVNRDIPENSLVYNQRELVIKRRITEDADGIPG